MSRLRLASVPFVNAEPLVWGFTSGPFRGAFDVTSVLPSQIPDLLRSGRIDAGLIPSIEYQRLDDVELIPYVGIASKRRARSVYLASSVPLDDVRRVALDEGSRTSAALLRMLLSRRGIREIAFGEHAPSLKAMLRDNDAALLIGDAALTSDTRGLHVYDLAAEWFAITGLPFVFAVWVVRAGVSPPDGARSFMESRRMGIDNIPSIARSASRRLRLSSATIEEYLRVNIHYHLATEEMRALDLFFRQALELGLVPHHRPFRFLQANEREPARVGRWT
jgi:chorismate dehydratase